MNWDDIRVFLAVARTGNLRRAAAILAISQPSVGRRLHALEAALGVALFTRSRGGHRLTAAGEALRPSAEAMERFAAELTRRSERLQRLPGGTVRISAAEWAALFLARHLPPEDDNGPTIELVSSERTEGLARREADLAVRHGLPVAGQFLTRSVGRMGTAIYGANDYLDRHPEALTAQRYRECRWVAFTEEQAHYQSMLWLAGRLGAKPPAVRVATTSLILDAVASGAGLGLLPCFLGDGDPRLSRAAAPLSELSADYWLIVPRELGGLARVRRAIDWVVARFGAERSTLLGDAREA